MWHLNFSLVTPTTRAVIISFLLGLTLCAKAQIKVQVIDSITANPLIHATVSVPATLFKISTDNNGIANIVLPDSLITTEILIQAAGYETRRILTANTGRQALRIMMSRTTYFIPEINVQPDLPVNLYFGKPHSQVTDFVVYPSYLVASVYHTLNGLYSLVLIDSTGRVLDETENIQRIEYLYADELGHLYAVSPSEVHEISIRRGILETKPVAWDFFFKKVIFYRGAYKNIRYLSCYSITAQSLIYFHEDMEKKLIYDASPFYIVSDRSKEKKASIELAKSEKTRLLEMREIVPDYSFSHDFLQGHEGDNSFFSKQRFIQRYLEHPLYAPYFQSDTGFCIFNFSDNKLSHFGFDLTEQKTIPIRFSQSGDWLGEVFKDRGNFYSIYGTTDKSIAFKRIGEDGSASVSGHSLHYPNTNHHRVINGFIYYIHQPKGYPLETFIFREPLYE